MSNESTSPTSAGNVNRKTSQDVGNVESGSNASFGQNIGRSENIENEPSRRVGSQSGSPGSKGSSSSPDSGWQSSGGRNSGSMESSDSSRSSRSGSSYGDKRGEH